MSKEIMHVFFWFFLAYAFLVQILILEIVREGRHGLLRLPSGKVSTFEVSFGAGLTLWFLALISISGTMEIFKENGQYAALILLFAGSLVFCCIFSETVTQFLARKLFRDVEFARFSELVRLPKN